MDAQENVEMVNHNEPSETHRSWNEWSENHLMACFNLIQMIETQAELRATLADIKRLEKDKCDLEMQKAQLESKLSETDNSEESKLVEDLKTQVFMLGFRSSHECSLKIRFRLGNIDFSL